MNEMYICNVFLTQKMASYTLGCNVYNYTALKDAKPPYVVFYNLGGKVVKYIDNIRTWQELLVQIDVIGKGKYEQDTFNKICDGLDGLCGEEIKVNDEVIGYIQSCVLEETRQDIENDFYRLSADFNIKVKK